MYQITQQLTHYSESRAFYELCICVMHINGIRLWSSKYPQQKILEPSLTYDPSLCHTCTRFKQIIHFDPRVTRNFENLSFCRDMRCAKYKLQRLNDLWKKCGLLSACRRRWNDICLKMLVNIKLFYLLSKKKSSVKVTNTTTITIVY